ncbi:MAG: putative DNA binding domain-containing protein [Rhodobacteraceae bacterium]|nr:putative DNA binding domain-containing protein [Paracoccaceae bacterium]
MRSYLPINIDDLLRNRGVESERVEFKATWDPVTVGPQVIRTLCAYANDLHNLNGGYIVIGVAEEGGHAALPPKGLTAESLEDAQKWIRGHCNRIDPPCQPLFSPETVDGRLILVIWMPASDTRPHRAPAGRGRQTLDYWGRIGCETVNTGTGNLLARLLEQTARVPWDDRTGPKAAAVEDLRENKVREYLHDVGSSLAREHDPREIYRRLRLVRRQNGHEVPRNIALLFFTHDPVSWFRGARIEVVHFTADAAGDVQEERVFSGSIPDQVRDCLNYLGNLSAHHLEKQRLASQVRGWVSYPLPALREILVNAVYHRGYDADQAEPIKIYLYPGRIEIISYPGPVDGIEPAHLTEGGSVPPVPARNRRIGEFLKDLKLAEGRLTGIPRVFQSMRRNESPQPVFDFDENRSYFRATLPAHPEYAALSAMQDAAHLRVLGQNEEAVRRVETAWVRNKKSPILAAEVIQARIHDGDIDRAEAAFDEFESQGSVHGHAHVRNRMIEALINAGDTQRAQALLNVKSPASGGGAGGN